MSPRRIPSAGNKNTVIRLQMCVLDGCVCVGPCQTLNPFFLALGLHLVVSTEDRMLCFRCCCLLVLDRAGTASLAVVWTTPFMGNCTSVFDGV